MQPRNIQKKNDVCLFKWLTMKGKIRKMNWQSQKLLEQRKNQSYMLRIEKLILLKVCMLTYAKGVLETLGLLHYSLNTTALASTKSAVDSLKQFKNSNHTLC